MYLHKFLIENSRRRFNKFSIHNIVKRYETIMIFNIIKQLKMLLYSFWTLLWSTKISLDIWLTCSKLCWNYILHIGQHGWQLSINDNEEDWWRRSDGLFNIMQSFSIATYKSIKGGITEYKTTKSKEWCKRYEAFAMVIWIHVI